MARRNKVGDEALVQMLCDDARLATGGTPKARANRKKASRGRLHRELILSSVCKCGEPAIVSIPVKGRNGATRYVKKCRKHAGLKPRPEFVREEAEAPKVKRVGVGIKVFA